jgi:hypothetical protein
LEEIDTASWDAPGHERFIIANLPLPHQ